jgi:hypothetical protein
MRPVDIRTLIVHLESPLSAYASAEVSPRDIVLAGLNWPTEYWAGLAVGWLEEGAPVDTEIVSALHAIVVKKDYSQGIRHRAFSLARRFEKGVSSNA